MTGTTLEPGEDSNSTGMKVRVNCADLVTRENPSTKGWLDSVRRLMLISPTKATGMPHEKILEGVLRNRGPVVIKVADSVEDLQTEMVTYNTLREHGVTGIVEYICFFTCSDSLAAVVSNLPVADDLPVPGQGLCDGPGTTMQVLVMEHVDGKSMKRFDWSKVGVETLASCLSQVVLTLAEAHLKCGFVHGDMHLDNVVLKRTKRATVTFSTLGSTVETHGLLPKLMDFELSRTGGPPVKFYKDLLELFNKSLGDLAWYVNVAPLQRCLLRVMDIIADADAIDVEDIPTTVAELLDTLGGLDAVPGARSPAAWGGGKERGRRLRPSLKKSRGLW